MAVYLDGAAFEGAVEPVDEAAAGDANPVDAGPGLGLAEFSADVDACVDWALFKLGEPVFVNDRAASCWARSAAMSGARASPIVVTGFVDCLYDLQPFTSSESPSK